MTTAQNGPTAQLWCVVMGCGFYGDVVMAGLMCDKTGKQPHRNLGKVLPADAKGAQALLGV